MAREACGETHSCDVLSWVLPSRKPRPASCSLWALVSPHGPGSLDKVGVFELGSMRPLGRAARRRVNKETALGQGPHTRVGQSRSPRLCLSTVLPRLPLHLLCSFWTPRPLVPSCRSGCTCSAPLSLPLGCPRTQPLVLFPINPLSHLILSSGFKSISSLSTPLTLSRSSRLIHYQPR